MSLVERKPTQTEAQLEAAATCPADEVGCIQADFSLVTLADRTRALLVHNPFYIWLNWLHGGIEFRLTVPVADFSANQAQSKAAQINAAR